MASKVKEPRLPIVNIGDAHIFFRNFAGKPTKFNKQGGVRTFCVELESAKMAADMKRDGWNVKFTKPHDESDDPKPYLEIKVSYNMFPPKIALIGSRGTVDSYLGEAEVEMLDWVEIGKIDLVINPSRWEKGTDRGVKGYLKSAYVTTIKDAFEEKYKNPADIRGETDEEELEEID